MLTVGTDSYIELSFAETYNGEKRVFAEDWTGATIDTKEKAIKEATLKIDRIRMQGVKADEDQLLQFPRIMTGIDDTIVPIEIKNAVCEEAYAILKFGNTARYNAQYSGVFSLTVEGVASESYNKKDLDLISKEASAYISQFRIKASKISSNLSSDRRRRRDLDGFFSKAIL